MLKDKKDFNRFQTTKMKESYLNTQEIQTFVYKLDLIDDYSNIYFDAEVEIKTSKREIVFNTKIRIDFNGYDNPGVLSIQDSNNKLDKNYFPQQLLAKYQDFEFLENKYLKVNGSHSLNSNIGKYTVIVRPIK